MPTKISNPKKSQKQTPSSTKKTVISKPTRKAGNNLTPLMNKRNQKYDSITSYVVPPPDQQSIEIPRRSRHVWRILAVIVIIIAIVIVIVIVIFGVWLPIYNQQPADISEQAIQNQSSPLLDSDIATGDSQDGIQVTQETDDGLIDLESGINLLSATGSDVLAKEAAVLAPQDIAVVIQNGSGVLGAARELAQLFTENGFIVLETGNADRFDYSSTQLVFDSDHRDSAEFIEDFLNTHDIAIESVETPNPQSHVTIILGS